MAHTGSLAGSIEAFDAVAGDVGVIRADTLDDAVEITELLVHTGAPPGRRLGAVTLSGAYRGLLLDSAERNRPRISATGARHHRAAQRRAHGRLTGRQSDRRRLRRAQQRRQFHGQHRRARMPIPTSIWCWSRRDCRALPAPIAPSTTSASPTTMPPPKRRSRSLRHPDLPWPDRLQPRTAGGGAARVVPARGLQGLARDRERRPAGRARTAGARRGNGRAAARRSSSARSSSARRSGDARSPSRSTRRDPRKCCAPTASPRRRRHWSPRAPKRSRQPSASAIRSCSRRCRRSLLHKSDLGAVALDLAMPARLGQPPMIAWRAILRSTASPACWYAARSAAAWSSVLGLHRDPEMGLVVMAGSGGCCSSSSRT